MPLAMRLRGANKNYKTREHVRRHLEDLRRNPRSSAAPQKLRAGLDLSSSEHAGWKVYTVRPASGRINGTVVYLHGGGWIHEAAPAHWSLAQQIAQESSVAVIVPVYPLAHEGGCAQSVVPAVADLCQSVAGPVALMGDSAGGSIAMSASLLLAQRGSPAALTVLICPALDLRFSNPEIEAVQPQDPWLVCKGQIELAEMWLGDHAEDPILNPVFGDAAAAGPMVVFSGTRDILNPDTRLFVRDALARGADLTYHEQPGHIHVYPLLPTPEGRRARKMIVAAVHHAFRF